MAEPARSSGKTIGLWLVLIVLFVAFWQFFSGEKLVVGPEEFRERARVPGAVVTVDVAADEGTGVGKTGPASSGPLPLSEFTALQQGGAIVVYREKKPPLLISIFLQWLLPALLLFAVLWVLQRVQRPASVPFDIAPHAAGDQRATLEGLFTAKEALQNAARAAKSGTAGPRKILIVGPPGSGKTQLVKWLAEDTGVPTWLVASSKFVDLYAGLGAHRIRAWMKDLRKAAPAIAAIDDLDVIAMRRAAAADARSDERTSTMMALADALDGTEKFPPKVLFLATTSREDLLDEAMLRPGRFDVKITLHANRASTIEKIETAPVLEPAAS